LWLSRPWLPARLVAKDDMKNELCSDSLEWDWTALVIGPIPRARTSAVASQRLLSPTSKVPSRFDFLSTCKRTSLSGESCTTKGPLSIFVASPVTVCESSRLRKNDAANRKSNGPDAWNNRTRLRKMAERDRRDGQVHEVPRTSNFGSRLSHMSRASRATVYGAGGIFQHPAKARSPTSNSGRVHNIRIRARTPSQKSYAALRTPDANLRITPVDCSKNRPECPHRTSSGRLWHRRWPH